IHLWVATGATCAASCSAPYEATGMPGRRTTEDTRNMQIFWTRASAMGAGLQSIEGQRYPTGSTGTTGTTGTKGAGGYDGYQVRRVPGSTGTQVRQVRVPHRTAPPPQPRAAPPGQETNRRAEIPPP